METLRERIERELRSQICRNCYGWGRDAACAAGSDCPLFENLDEVIEVVRSIRDVSVGPYHERLRAVVCSHCRLDSTGHCRRSNQLNCALDVYFPQIVAIIENELYPTQLEGDNWPAGDS